MSTCLAESGPTPQYWRQFDALVRVCPFEASRRRLSNGSDAYFYQAGPRDAPRIVLVSPAESPFLLFSRVGRELARTHRVMAWDNSTAAFMEAPFSVPPPTLQRMAEDLLCLIEAEAGDDVHVVSWCSGALIALWTMDLAPGVISSASFIAPPSVLGLAPDRTDFQSRFLHMILELASGTHPDEAGLCRQILEVPRERPILDEVDQAIADLTRQPVRNEIALRRYAKSIQNACLTLPPGRTRSGHRAYVDIVAERCGAVPMALLHCRDDDVVSYKCSADVAARNDNVRFVMYPRGGHFVIYKEPEMLSADIASFVAHVRRPRREGGTES